ncbi:FAD-dependent monooxygenase [Sporosarcina sp. G11-34]|uniref:FAD-dependent monooxygenase n=1 Tax=Sporosarcina sp. G11-34 TaxID=2849605 RepID=UPI0022A97D95|nr:FAD-dependent monooxygenase [Sporosarcina sp. G11-34]
MVESLQSGTVTYNKKCIDIQEKETYITAYFEDEKQVTADLLIAADGIHSPIRKKLVPDSAPRYAGYTCWRGITENRNRVHAHTSSEIWSTDGRFGYAPLKNGDVYWFACVKVKERDAFFKQLKRNELANLFSDFPEFVPSLIRDTNQEQILHHDIQDIKPLRRFVYGRVVLLGDAAHATTPNMGQGAGQAIEDALVLGNAIGNMETIEHALKHYEEQRVARTKKVISLSRQIGWAAQISFRPLAANRDFLFPFIPSNFFYGG